MTSRRAVMSAPAVLASIALSAAVAAGQPAPGPTRRLTIERIAASPNLLGTAPGSPEWSPDSRTLAFLWNDQARPARDVWTVSSVGGKPVRLTNVSGAGGCATAPPAGASEPASGSGASVAEVTWAPDGETLFLLCRGNVFSVPRAGGALVPLTRTGGSKSDLAVSPDGRFVSFLQDGDLWLITRPAGDLVRATHVGVPGPGTVPLGTYNRPDVEFGRYVWGGALPAYLWSPDSRTVALHYVDRRKVRKVPFPYYLGDETTVNELRRGYPGDHDEIRTLAFYHVGSGQLRMLEFPDQGWRFINGYAWADGERLLIDQQTDTQQDRWLLFAHAATGAMEEVWHDQRASRVYNAVEALWDAVGRRILMIGDLDDRYRLYDVNKPGTPPAALTPATYDITGVAVAGTGAQRAIFVVSNEVNPYERHVYRMPASGGAAVRITTRPGTHQPFVAPDGSAVALLSTSDTEPTELYLANARDGRPETRVTTSPPAEFGEYRWARPRYVTFKSRIDDHTLHARILEPPNLDRTKKYPIVFGPVYSNTVRNRWAGANATLQQFLAVERQAIVVQVDVRGSTGYGRTFREQFLGDYGGRDLDDLQSALEYLETLPYADTKRAGLWGSSYGGLLTVYMLFKKPGVFKAGVAGAAAVDPRFFGVDDVAITRLPNTDPEIFRKGVAAQYAKNLRDPLLFIHGMQDDVVPFKTIVDLMEQLMRLGKDFDIALAPAATHGWTQRDYYATFMYRKLVTHFERHLGLQPASPVAVPAGSGADARR